MTRSARLLSAPLLALPVAARAQLSAPTSAPAEQSQLDRIEDKFDEVLRRLDHLQRQSPVAVGRQAGLLGHLQPSSLAPGEPPASSQAAYKPDAVAVAHLAPKDIDTLSELLADDVGGFIYEGGPITLTDICSRGVRYAGLSAWKSRAGCGPKK